MFPAGGFGDAPFGSYPAPAETVWKTLFLSRSSVMERPSFWQYSKYTARGCQSPMPPSFIGRSFGMVQTVVPPPLPCFCPNLGCEFDMPTSMIPDFKPVPRNLPKSPAVGPGGDAPFVYPKVENVRSLCLTPNPETELNPTAAKKSESSHKKRNIFTTVESYLIKIAEFYNKLCYRHCYSPGHYKMAVNKLLTKSRSLFYILESHAVRDVISKNNSWKTTEKAVEAFQHNYLLLADNLAVNLLQLILTYSEYGFISVDQDDPLSISSFYRGEMRLGRVLPGVYQMHVTSLQYTTLTNLLQLSPCPLEHVKIQHQQNEDSLDLSTALDLSNDSDLDISHLSKNCDEGVDLLTDDINDLPMTTDEIEETSNYLKMLRWQVRFNQNPDMEDENYYLCCKAVRPHYDEPEFILQLDSVQYVFGKMVSPKMNFHDPSLEEIVLDCRPVGRFEVLHSFGHSLPTYTQAVGVLVDYLRHKRFKRTVF